MARIRTIKPEFWKHEELSALPEATHMLAAALLNYADDFGYFNANPMLIRAECFPLREPSVSVPESLRSLHEMGYLEFATGSDGKRYGRIVHFAEHQRVSHATPSKIQAMAMDWENSGESPENFQNPPEPLRPEGNGRERKGTEENAADAATTENGKYKFEHGVVRLTAKDFDKWKQAYSHLDLAAELIALAPWAAEQRNWFHAVPAALAKRNRELKHRTDAAKNGGPHRPLTPSGNPWPEGIV